MTDHISLEELYRQTVTFPGPAIPLSGLLAALDTVEEELAHARDQAAVRLRARHQREAEFRHPEDLELDAYELEVTTNQILPRVFRGGFLLTLWSVFETVAKRMAEYVSTTRGLPTMQPQFRQPHFLKSLQKVYTESLGIVAFPDATEYGEIDTLRQVRNALIHHNGNVSALPDSMRNLSQEDLANLGLNVYSDLHETFFVPDAPFLTRSLSLVHGYLTSLSDRAYASAHPVPLVD
ncbi:MAG: hypothetical protein HY525_13475 [Betaproteobacteria bacterium]|nr:hypothetical protein [Betaproteobacteria bacterium]